MLVDAHVHVASADTARFPRRPTGVGSDWWHRPAGVSELLATLDANGVDRAVVVQAVGVYGYDCRYAADAVGQAPSRLALVGAVDMAAPDPAAEVAAIAGLGRLAGVRVFAVGGDEPSWLSDGRAAAVWDAAADLGSTVVATVFDRHLAAVADLAGRRPDVPVALDHCGFVAPGDVAAMAALEALAALPSMSLKVSSHVLAAAAEAGDPAAFVDRLMTAFGPDRLCWGSDHPQHQSLTYAEMLALARRATRHLDDAGRDQFFAGTSTRLWW